MKILGLILTVVILNIYQANAQYIKTGKGQVADSTIFRAKKLKQLYTLSTASSAGLNDVYKQQFFDQFPSTYEQLNELYGYDYKTSTAAPLESLYYEHIIGLFNKLNDINDTSYYKKIVSIGIGGHWDADAVNAFQDGLRSRVLTNPRLVVFILKDMPYDKIKSFWYFYFDGVHPKKQIPEQLQKIKLINNKIYNLMIEAQNEVLKQPKE
jgi:hypothetical protein